MDKNITSPLTKEEYQIMEIIGVGSYSTVYHGKIKTNNIDVAIKIIDLEKVDITLDEISFEVKTISLLHHPNIINVYVSFVVDQEIWIVMPYLPFGSCLDILKSKFRNGIKDEVLLASIIRQLLLGLEYIHTEGYIHRDIKCANILVSNDGSILLGDFGVAGKLFENGFINKTNRHTFTGTPCWMAPEVVDNINGYNDKADIWSVGITCLELAFGRAPYSIYEPMKAMLKIIGEDPPTAKIYNDNSYIFSDDFQSFVKKCLKKDPSERYSIKKLLKHKFLKKAKDSSYIFQIIS